MAEIHEFPKQEITFDEFWRLYPRKVGKLAAKREWEKALRHDSAQNIIAGLERVKPYLSDDPQYVPHPRTFLSQGRWMDEAPPRKKYAWESEAEYQRYLKNG